MKRLIRAGIAVTLSGTALVAAPTSPAQGAGIVTHSWMALDAVDHVRSDDLRVLLDAHRDQVRAGAEFPDGGYITRSLGTPGGDYGEEAHWQRFTEAYADAIRTDPSCGDLTDPAGPCADEIAHLMGAAGHGVGDEVFDWLVEPNGPAFDEPAYRPPDIAPFTGPGGLEAQLDIVAIARHGRPVDPTVAIPNPSRIAAAFAAVGRTDILAEALGVGDEGLEIERSVEAYWASIHLAGLERAMPYTSAHLVDGPGGVEFAARAIAGYYDALWARLVGTTHRTRVSVATPAPGARTVPATGWTGRVAPGSNEPNVSGRNRIAAVLTSAVPFNRTVGGPPVSDALPADAMRLRDLRTGALVAARDGFPRAVPYGAESGTHTVAWQPATDLAPCRWYRVEITEAMVDADARPVRPMQWRFKTSGCTFRGGATPTPITGTVSCAGDGFALAGDPNGDGGVLARLGGCVGGQDGTPATRASLPIASGALALSVAYASGACTEVSTPSGDATVQGAVRWDDASGRTIGWSAIPAQPLDPRGGRLRIDDTSHVLGGAPLALRMPEIDAAGCTPGGVLPFTSARVTAWSD